MTSSVGQTSLAEMGKAAQKAGKKLARESTEVRNQALLNLADALEQDHSDILSANTRDCTAAQADGLNQAMLDRLLLTPDRLKGMAQDVRNIAALPDPVGESMETKTLDNGLRLEKRRVPLGVIASIYESRPNITIDIAALCLKSGNACILRGGKESLHSNTALIKLIHRALAQAGVIQEAVQFIDNPDRSLINTLLQMKEYVSLLIPRGGSDLIKFVAENATMPVVTGGIGVCHTYVDRNADLNMAADIIFNAKVQRPSVCNALDTVLLHADIAPNCLPLIAGRLGEAGVELRCDHRALSILGPGASANIVLAADDDWGQEFLALVASVKVVDSLDDALAFIETYGSGHSDAIITEDSSAAERFLDEVDSCAVYVNASTRFTDGGQFGFGAEVGISTQKFHARGPMGLRELTSYKWLVRGSGQIRP
ncbi:MAG: glutamate-5-semialdehyde dehydrogenase [Chloroflexi bacterium]|nr:glutamate-5-semialdehyde dehydrogenase [Chloroflexota bacterium]